MKKYTVITSFFLAIFAFVPGTTLIARADNAAMPCNLTAPDFAAIQAVRSDPTLTPAGELSQELALRKQLLGKTIACAKSDAQALQQTLLSVSANDPAATTIQSQLSGKISDAINFYDIESAKVSGAGIASTEVIAKELIAWRAANYDPLEGQVDNLILWSQDETLFQTAESRVAQTSKIVSFIEVAAPNNDLQNNFNAARVTFQTAESQNIAAENELAQFLPPGQSLALIQQSLQSLAAAYQKFSTLNSLLQKLLPTTSQ